MKELKFPQKKKEGLLQWIKTLKFVILGSLYILFNILISYVYIKNQIDYRAGELHLSLGNWHWDFLWFLDTLVSLVIYIIYVKLIKKNPKPLIYFVIFPGILWIITLILSLIYQQSYLDMLCLNFYFHLMTGGLSFCILWVIQMMKERKMLY